jgi:hypothetical protein
MEELKHEVEDNLALVNYVVSMRIYDVLIAVLRNLNPNEAEALVEAHSRGILLAPPPSYVVESDVD